MDTRRTLLGLAFGMVGAAVMRRTGSAQSTDGQRSGRAREEDDLPSRGAPTGRTGAATRNARGGEGELTLDLVAPLRGVGLTSVERPQLCYILSGKAVGSTRLTVSAPGQARPLAQVDLPRAQSPGLGTVRLRDHGVRLPPNLLCVWSVTLALDPRAPSEDLVASALVQHRTGDPVVEAASREASPDRRIAALVRAGYWYDAVALAEQVRGSDGGAALASLLKVAELRPVAGPDVNSAR